MLFYRELAAPEELSHLVLSFWEFTARSETAEPIMHEIFPDGCISLTYRRNRKFGINGFGTNFLNTRSIAHPVFDGDIFWGARLSPAACARVLGTDPGKWKVYQWDGRTPMFGIFDDKLLSAIASCANFEEGAAIYAARFAGLGISREDLDQKVLEAVARIEESRGEIRIAALADELGLSTRQFERRFKNSAGLTPKQYVRARRFRAAAAALVEDETVKWADRAAEMGFADQAHLAHEFSDLTGRSPVSFARKVKKIDHGPLVK
jgi:AraC-like DNA-binding protein